MATSFVSSGSSASPSFIALDLAKDASRLVLQLLEQPAQGYGDLANQARRATTSVALNLAEGSGRSGRDRMRHYRIALGSAKEAAVAFELLVDARAVPATAGREALHLLDRLCAITWRLTHPRQAG